MTRASAPAAAVDSYLGEVSRLATLSREMELELATRVRQGHEATREAVLSRRAGVHRVLALLREVAAGDRRPGEVLATTSEPGAEDEPARADAAALAAELERLLGSPCACPPTDACRCEALAAFLERVELTRATLDRLYAELKRERAPGPPGTEWAATERVVAEGRRAKAQLAEGNLRLVVALARRYAHRGLPLADLIQEGNLGLLRAIDGFDPTRGFRLATYAAWWIRQGILHALIEQTRTIRVPRHMTDAASAVSRFRRGFQHDAGRVPTAEEVADGLGVSVARVEAVSNLGPDAVSLETPIGDEDSLELGDVLADSNSVSPADTLLMKDFTAQTQGALATLLPEEQSVVALRFGLGGCPPHTVEEVGAALQISTERVRQAESRALRKLRQARRTRNLRDYARG